MSHNFEFGVIVSGATELLLSCKVSEQADRDRDEVTSNCPRRSIAPTTHSTKKSSASSLSYPLCQLMACLTVARVLCSLF
jgi:hypothetical protein